MERIVMQQAELQIPSAGKEPSAISTEAKSETGFTVERKGNQLFIKIPEQADRLKSRICINGTEVTDFVFTLPEEGMYTVSYELKDSEGKVIESSEKSILFDETAPMISMPSALWIYDSMQLDCLVEDSALAYYRASLDEQSLTSLSDIRISRANRQLIIQAADQNGNYTEKKMQITAAGKLQAQMDAQGNILAADHVLRLHLDGPWEGMILQIQYEGKVVEIPFESADLQVPLEKANGICRLVHPLMQETPSWNFVTPKKEETDKQPEAKPDTNPQKPQIQNPDNQKPADTIIQKPEISTPAEAAGKEETAPGKPVSGIEQSPNLHPTTAQKPESSLVQIPAGSKPEPKPIRPLLKKGGQVFESGSKVLVSSPKDLELFVENGEAVSVIYRSFDTKKQYASLEEALAQETMPVIELEGTFADINGESIEQNWTLIPCIDDSQYFLQPAENGQQSWMLNEWGEVSSALEEMKPVSAMLCKEFEQIEYQQVKKGDQLRLYFEGDSNDLCVRIDGKITDHEILQDELGQNYIPIQARDGMNVQLRKGGETIFEKQIQAETGGSAWLMASGLIGAAGLIAAGIFRRKKHG